MNITTNSIKSLGLFTTGILLLISIVINQPFLTISYVPRIPRLIFEGLILIALVIVYLRQQQNKYINWVFACFTLVLGLSYFLNQDELIRYIGFFNKTSFGILFYYFLKSNPQHLRFLKLGWILIWIIIAIWSIGTFFTFLFFPEFFHIVEFGKIDVYAPYTYYLSNWYQFVIPRTYFGNILIGRVVAVFFEPIQLGFFAWFNVLLGRVLFKQKKWQILYTSLSFCVGLLSFSLFFYVVAILLTPIQLLKNWSRFNKYWKIFGVFWALLLVSFWFANLDLFFSFGSANNRLLKINAAFSALADNSFWSFLFGNGINISLKYMPHAFSNGLFEILLTKGTIIFLIVIGFIAYVIRKDFILLISVIIWSFGLNPFYYLLFYFLLILAYCSNNEESVVWKSS